MFNAHVLSTSDCGLADGPMFCLRKNIAAIQVLPSGTPDEPRLGTITQLPAGAELASCGPGFNERTLKVRWAGGLYFVFLQDLEVPMASKTAV